MKQTILNTIFDAVKFTVIVIAVLAAFSALGGCMSMTPALGGKTHIDAEFTESLGPDGINPDTTGFKYSVDAPAGVEITDIAGFEYQWDSEGGRIAVNSDNNINTQGQAAALVQVSAFETALAKAIAEALAQPIASALSIAVNPLNGVGAPASGGGGNGALIDMLRDVLANGDGGLPPDAIANIRELLGL